LTLSPTPRNTELDRELHHVLNDPGYPGSFSLSPPDRFRDKRNGPEFSPDISACRRSASNTMSLA
jgi:hypothetical protein